MMTPAELVQATGTTADEVLAEVQKRNPLLVELAFTTVVNRKMESLILGDGAAQQQPETTDED